MSTPLGMIRKASPNVFDANDAAALDTATRASSRRHTRRRTGAAAASSVERSAYAWNVATTGAGERSAANIDVLGVNGSWTCTTSGPNAANASEIRRIDAGLGQIRATDPLYGMATGLPTTRTHGSRGARLPGVTTRISCPRVRSSADSWRTCTWTPPGASHEYGDASAILTRSGAAPPIGPRVPSRPPTP